MTKIRTSALYYSAIKEIFLSCLCVLPKDFSCLWRVTNNPNHQETDTSQNTDFSTESKVCVNHRHKLSSEIKTSCVGYKKNWERHKKNYRGEGQIDNKSLTCLIMTQQRSQGSPGVAMAGDTGALAQGHGTSNTEKATEQRGEGNQYSPCDGQDWSWGWWWLCPPHAKALVTDSTCHWHGRDAWHETGATPGWCWSFLEDVWGRKRNILSCGQSPWVPQVCGSSGNLVMAPSVTAPGGDSRTLLRSPGALSTGKVLSLTGEVMGQPGTCPWASPVWLCHSSGQLLVVWDGMESGPGLLN